MLPDHFSRPHKEKREKAVWQREINVVSSYYCYYIYDISEVKILLRSFRTHL